MLKQGIYIEDSSLNKEIEVSDKLGRAGSIITAFKVLKNKLSDLDSRYYPYLNYSINFN
jgi:hypothetical protein